MAWNQHLSNLRDLLADLIFEKREIRDLCQDAGLTPAYLNLDGKVITVWHEVLREAEKRGKVDDVVRAAINRYPENELLQLALKQPLSNAQGPDIHDKINWQSGQDEQTLEKIIGRQSTLLPINFLEIGFLKAKSVARVVLGNDLSGTGFLTDNNLLVTNHHVLKNEQMASSAMIQFNVQQNVDGMDYQPVEMRCAPEDDGFLTSEEDDWTLVRLAQDANTAWGSIPIKAVSASKDDRVIIIQHPGGGPKAIALYHNMVTFADDDRVQYLTDTMPGSSGSPVFDSEWNLVAVHHSGGWLREPDSKQRLFRNEGIAIARILKGGASLLNE